MIDRNKFWSTNWKPNLFYTSKNLCPPKFDEHHKFVIWTPQKILFQKFWPQKYNGLKKTNGPQKWMTLIKFYLTRFLKPPKLMAPKNSRLPKIMDPNINNPQKFLIPNNFWIPKKTLSQNLLTLKWPPNINGSQELQK